jgi:hypothetical protein
MRLDQRAWVGISNVFGVPTLHQIWKTVVVYHNSGKTPARNLFGIAVSDPVPAGKSPDFSYVHDRLVHGGMIPPNGDYSSPIFTGRSKSTGKYSPLDQPAIDELTSGRLRVYTHGRIVYDDIFGCRHWLTFCYFFNPEVNSFSVCATHNDTGDIQIEGCRH